MKPTSEAGKREEGEEKAKKNNWKLKKGKSEEKKFDGGKTEVGNRNEHTVHGKVMIDGIREEVVYFSSCTGKEAYVWSAGDHMGLTMWLFRDFGGGGVVVPEGGRVIKEESERERTARRTLIAKYY